MQTTFTKQFMSTNRGCYSVIKLRSCSFMQSEEITLDSILQSEIPLRHKYWFVCKKPASKQENRQIAIGVAEIVLHIYERRYPDDMRPREAIKAAKQFIAGHINIDALLEKKRTADAAAYAAYAAAAAAADVEQQLFEYLIAFCSTH